MNKVLLNYINNNKKIFIKLLIAVLIGIIIGTIYFEIIDNSYKDEIKEFIDNLKGILKQKENVNYVDMLKISFKHNILNISVFAISGFFVFGTIVIYAMLMFKGITLGFTISSFFYSYKLSLNFWIMIFLLVLQNIIVIPSLLLIAEKSYKINNNLLLKSISIKEELCKQIIVMLILIMLNLIASLIEIYISMNFLIIF